MEATIRFKLISFSLLLPPQKNFRCGIAALPRKLFSILLKELDFVLYDVVFQAKNKVRFLYKQFPDICSCERNSIFQDVRYSEQPRELYPNFQISHLELPFHLILVIMSGLVQKIDQFYDFSETFPGTFRSICHLFECSSFFVWVGSAPHEIVIFFGNTGKWCLICHWNYTENNTGIRAQEKLKCSHVTMMKHNLFKVLLSWV